MIYLSIGGIPICGAVGGEITMITRDCWDAYCRIIESTAEPDTSICVMHKNIPWTVNGWGVKEPTAYFISMVDDGAAWK